MVRKRRCFLTFAQNIDPNSPLLSGYVRGKFRHFDVQYRNIPLKMRAIQTNENASYFTPLYTLRIGC